MVSAFLLTGKMDEKTAFAKGDVRNNYPRFSPEVRSANRPLVDDSVELPLKGSRAVAAAGFLTRPSAAKQDFLQVAEIDEGGP
jgi:hypothetical protein